METKLYDPIIESETMARIVCKYEGKSQERKYYRYRGGRWYGGIATADCVGCNLKCKFCWSWRIRDNADHIGYWQKAIDVSSKLIEISKSKRYRYLRISGGEPTLCFDHLIEVIKNLDEEMPDLIFILETNGILLGYREEYVERLSRFSNIHVRVSIKGCSPMDFERLTGAYHWGFSLQLRALQSLSYYGISAHPAVMMSFSDLNECQELRKKLEKVNKKYVDEFEEEFVIMYPHVRKILEKNRLKPHTAFDPNGIPEEFI